MELFGLFIKGGYVMYPLLLCSFIAVIIFVERLRFYRSMLDDVNALRETIIPLVQQSNWKGLQALKETSKGMATHVIAEAARGGNNKEQQEKLSSVFSLVFGFSVVLLCNFLLFTNSKASVFDSNKLYVEEFKDFGFTGKVEVLEKTQLIEPYVGSRTSLHYDEKLSDGSYFWELIDVVEVRSGTHVTKLDDQLAEEISKYLETDEEKELFDKVKKQEFQFVLFLYKDLIRKRNIDTELIDKVNNAVGFKLVEKYGLSLYPKNPPEFYSLIIKNALKNRANGDTEVAGFYNIDVLNKAMIAYFGYVNYLEFDQFLKDKNASRVDYLKKILSEIPSGTLEDGTYKFTGTTKVDGKDQLVTVTMVIENGSSHFEADEMRNP